MIPSRKNMAAAVQNDGTAKRLYKLQMNQTDTSIIGVIGTSH
jgi:hypothetical protein